MPARMSPHYLTLHTYLLVPLTPFVHSPPCCCSGMDFYVVLDRPGYNVAKRRQRLSRVGVQHKVTKEDAMKWFQTKFEGVVLNKSHAL